MDSSNRVLGIVQRFAAAFVYCFIVFSLILIVVAIIFPLILSAASGGPIVVITTKKLILLLKVCSFVALVSALAMCAMYELDKRKNSVK